MTFVLNAMLFDAEFNDVTMSYVLDETNTIKSMSFSMSYAFAENPIKPESLPAEMAQQFNDIFAMMGTLELSGVMTYNSINEPVVIEFPDFTGDNIFSLDEFTELMQMGSTLPSVA